MTYHVVSVGKCHPNLRWSSTKDMLLVPKSLRSRSWTHHNCSCQAFSSSHLDTIYTTVLLHERRDLLAPAHGHRRRPHQAGGSKAYWRATNALRCQRTKLNYNGGSLLEPNTR
ncbi:hypothetical protein SETIT_1G133100v2 [Setaria italica]|uniref:Uncharacterized protein n=1 Tax=Setaria italica TaxID=4555 RepID=A0A368PKW3_SETIT|nr:hypothetical protein SETIT_1G133100v2 [Setaria italica]RCV06058.1 hypothetical protein SETIT_1G133100v2 [Setaria italica]